GFKSDQDENRDASLDEEQADTVGGNDRAGGFMLIERQRILGITCFAAKSTFITNGERIGDGMAILVQLEFSGVILLPGRKWVALAQVHSSQSAQDCSVFALVFIKVVLGHRPILRLVNRLVFIVHLWRAISKGILHGFTLIVGDVHRVHVIGNDVA